MDTQTIKYELILWWELLSKIARERRRGRENLELLLLVFVLREIVSSAWLVRCVRKKND